jgi:hypothetical protein
MSYRVDRFNGTFLVSVNDGTIDTSTDIKFIGKNYAGYGEVQNENFLHLLENFSNTTPPSKPVQGQIWFDSSNANKKLKFYDGNQWKTASGSVASTSSPSNATAGDFWFDLTTNQLYVWNGGSYVLVGPENAEDVTSTAIVPADLRGTDGGVYKVLKINVDTTTVAIISDNVFTINRNVNEGTPVTNFSLIRRGINLVNSGNEQGITTDTERFWGTSSNSILFDGNPTSVFVRQEQLGIFPNSGYTIGNKFASYIKDNNFPIIENRDYTNQDASITFRILADSLTTFTEPLIVKRNGIYPSSDSRYSIGSESLKWLNVYADTFVGDFFGDLTGVHKGNLLRNSGVLHFDAETGTFFGTFGSPSSPGTFFGNFTGEFSGDLDGTAARALSLAGYDVSEQVPSEPVGAGRVTIPIRDTEGNLYATNFKGTADRANLLLVGTSYRTTSLAPDNNTIAVRDQFGDISANVFRGTATSAQYADLAEKYLADKEYETGTVVVVGGEKEITSSSEGERAIGVISKFPAFRMNEDLENGVFVALKGRVPVMINEKIKKGDRLVASNNGKARPAKEPNDFVNVFAIAIEDSDVDSVEAVIL